MTQKEAIEQLVLSSSACAEEYRKRVKGTGITEPQELVDLERALSAIILFYAPRTLLEPALNL